MVPMPIALTRVRRLRNTDSGVASLSRISQPRLTLINIANLQPLAPKLGSAPRRRKSKKCERPLLPEYTRSREKRLRPHPDASATADEAFVRHRRSAVGGKQSQSVELEIPHPRESGGPVFTLDAAPALRWMR